MIDTAVNTGFSTAALLCKFTIFHFSVPSLFSKVRIYCYTNAPFLPCGTSAVLIFTFRSWYLLAILKHDLSLNHESFKIIVVFQPNILNVPQAFQ